MNKKKVPFLVGIFFLVQVTSSHGLSTETFQLNPQTRVSQTEANICFEKVYDTVSVSLSLYKKDAIARNSTEALKREFGTALYNRTVRFDLDRIGSKGYTRYYPVYVSDTAFVVRVFLTAEASYQPKAPVLFEAAMVDPAVTIQVLPGVNSILKAHQIEPYRIYPDSDTGRSL